MSGFLSVSLFWAFVLVSIAIALAAVLPALLRRKAKGAQVDRAAANIAIYQDQLAELKSDFERGDIAAAQYEEARTEIEKRLSEDVPAQSTDLPEHNSGRWAGFALAGLIPVAAIALYLAIGTPEAITQTGDAASSTPAMMQGMEDAAAAQEMPPPGMGGTQGKAHDLASMVQGLEAKLEKNPDNVEGWLMLGRSYFILQRPDDAVRAVAKAVELQPKNATVLAAYAEALAMAQGEVIAGKPLEYVNRALKINPSEEKALELSAVAASQSGDYAKEALYWRKLLKVLPPDNAYIADVTAAAEQAERAAGMPSSKPAASAPKSEIAEIGSISGTVSLSKSLASKASPDDVVFIVAKPVEGGRMPLAILKIQVRELPYRFSLSDANAMLPSDRLSQHATVTVSARVSKSGDAMVKSGDLEGKLTPVKVGQQNLNLTIDTAVP